MNYYTMLFSPTGGTKKILNALTQEFPIPQKHQIDLSSTSFTCQQHFTERDCCFIAVPSFGGRVPNIVLERLSQYSPQNTPAFLVVSFGNRAIDDTLIEFKNEVERMGFVVFGAISAVAEHSIVRKYGKNRPDNEDLKELAQFSKKIKSFIEEPNFSIQLTEFSKKLSIPGKLPYKIYNGVPFAPKGNYRCCDCKSCIFACPVAAIPLENPKSTDKELCIACMRCVKICPKHSRHIPMLTTLIVGHKIKKGCITRKENTLYLGN